MPEHQSKRRKGQHAKRHQWTLQENKSYLLYLQQHHHLFKDLKTKKIAKVFVNLAQQVHTRNTAQVKSHHQKMIAKYGSIPNVIVYLSQEQEVFGKDGSDSQETNKPQDPQSPQLEQTLEGNQHHQILDRQIVINEQSAFSQHEAYFLAPNLEYQGVENERICSYESEDFERKASEFFDDVLS